MKITNNETNQNELNFLRSLRGKKIKGIEGYFLFSNSDLYSDVIKVTLEDDFFYITCKYKLINFSKKTDSKEEFADLRISRTDQEIWLPSGTKLTKKKMSQTIEEIIVVYDEIYTVDYDEEFSVENTQAFCFKTPKGYIVFQKESWLTEMIRVSAGQNLESQLKDISDDWDVEDNEGTCRIIRRIVRLSEKVDMVNKIVMLREK